MSIQLRETSVLHAPRDWWEGWRVLNRRRKQSIADLKEDRRKAERFFNDTAIDNDSDRILYLQMQTPVNQAVLGIGIPFIGADFGSMIGSTIAAMVEIPTYEKIIHYPLPVAIGVLAASTLAGAAVGLLETLSLTPQARAGKEERLRRLHPQKA